MQCQIIILLLPNHLHRTRTQSHHWMAGPPSDTLPSIHSGATMETIPTQPMATSLADLSTTQQIPVFHNSAPQTKTLQHLCHHRGKATSPSNPLPSAQSFTTSPFSEPGLIQRLSSEYPSHHHNSPDTLPASFPPSSFNNTHGASTSKHNHPLAKSC